MTLDPMFRTVSDFCPQAVEMREALDDFFTRAPSDRKAQLWNYWYIPNAYAYLKTCMDNLISTELCNRFMEGLNEWAAENLGLTATSWPYLSLYVNGCHQCFHNDASAGRFAYVLSLSRPERCFRGGATLIMREEPYWNSQRQDEATSPLGLYHRVEPHFNQLAVFDDRCPHAVETVQGSMDPRDGRLVLHGHLDSHGAFARGALAEVEEHRVLEPLLASVGRLYTLFPGTYSGLLTLRLEVNAIGAVDSVHRLVHRLIPQDGSELPAWEEVAGWAGGLRFPASGGASRIILPLWAGPATDGCLTL